MSTRREFLAAAAIAPLAARDLGAAPGGKPNVLFIFTDDQRYDTIAALGNPHIKTPCLDRLARRSFVFRNAYNFGGNTGAVCIPARNMAMSGQTFFRFGGKIRANPNGPTFPKSMKAAGYETYYREKSGSANLPQIRKQFEHYKDIHMVSALQTGYAARGIVDDAIAFLGKERDRARPFFMYLGFPCPHDPRYAAAEFRKLYDPAKIPLPPNYRPLHPYDMGMMTIRDECLEAWPRTKQAIRRHLHDYYSLISSMDHDIGRLLDALDRLSLTKETIVIFSSDQGVALGSHGLMGKQNIYEDTQKVPLLFSGPGIAPGESEAFVYVHDIYPTVCEMTGATAPQGIDGQSLAPIVSGKRQKVRDTIMLAYRNTQRPVRDERWKLIQLPKINRTQLFDIEADPRETRDLSAEPSKQKVVKRMLTLLAKEQKKYGDNLPLKSDAPRPPKFIPPTKKKRTAHPAGGLAPGLTKKKPK